MEKLLIYEFKKVAYSLAHLQKECDAAFPDRSDGYAIYSPDDSERAYFVFTEEGFEDVIFEQLVAESDRKRVSKEEFISKEGTKVNGKNLGSYKLFKILRSH